MLSERSAQIVRTTLPAVEPTLAPSPSCSTAACSRNGPELLRDLFNRANQASGAQKEALAGAVAAFATALVEHPDERPRRGARRIANKHASLGITSDQYTLVARHLLGRGRRSPRRRSDPGGGLRLGRGLLADGQRSSSPWRPGCTRRPRSSDGDVWRTMEVAERSRRDP